MFKKMLLDGLYEILMSFMARIGAVHFAIGLTQNFTKGMIDENYGYMWDAENYDLTPEPWRDIMEVKKESREYFQTTSVVGLGTMRETAESEGFSPRTPTEGYTVYSRMFTFTDMIEVSKNTVNYHQKIKDITKEQARIWGGSLKTTRNTFFATFFNEGGKTAGHRYFNGTPESGAVTDSSGDVLYDAEPLFNLSNNTRSSKGGGTYYNGHALEATADNFETILNLAQGTNNRDENDEVISIRMNYVLYPQQLEFTIRRLLESVNIPGSDDNDTNVLNNYVQPVRWDFLTDTDAYFFGCKKKGVYALMGLEPKLNFFEDERNRTYCATIEWSIGCCFHNWRFFTGSKFSTS